MNAPALYILADEYLRLANHLADLDFDPETIKDTIESSGITDQIAEKVQGCEMIARMFEADNPAIDAEIERLQALKRTRNAKAEALRKYVLQNMQMTGIQRIDTPLFSVSIAKNPDSVEIFDERQIPADYMADPKPPAPRPDKRLIAQALKEGISIPGARIAQSMRLSVK